MPRTPTTLTPLLSAQDCGHRCLAWPGSAHSCWHARPPEAAAVWAGEKPAARPSPAARRLPVPLGMSWAWTGLVILPPPLTARSLGAGSAAPTCPLAAPPRAHWPHPHVRGGGEGRWAGGERKGSPRSEPPGWPAAESEHRSPGTAPGADACGVRCPGARESRAPSGPEEQGQLTSHFQLRGPTAPGPFPPQPAGAGEGAGTAPGLSGAAPPGPQAPRGAGLPHLTARTEAQRCLSHPRAQGLSVLPPPPCPGLLCAEGGDVLHSACARARGSHVLSRRGFLPFTFQNKGSLWVL